MKNEGLTTIVVIDGCFIEHEREKVEELLHLVAKVLGAGLPAARSQSCVLCHHA